MPTRKLRPSARRSRPGPLHFAGSPSRNTTTPCATCWATCRARRTLFRPIRRWAISRTRRSPSLCPRSSRRATRRPPSSSPRPPSATFRRSRRAIPWRPARTQCATQFIQKFGQRAFRRPVTQDETTSLLALYQANSSSADYKNGIQSVIEAIVQSAPFLYRPEFGIPGGAQGGVVPLTSYEMASRLSYFFWGSMPDDALFAAADGDQLRSPAQIAMQAARLLADAKAQPAVSQFFGEWLGVNSIANAPKDPVTYPEYTSDVRTAMQQETLAFVDWVMWKSDAKLATLLTAPVSFLNQSLAQVYGISGVTGTALQQVQLDPTQRAGIVTQGAVMAILAKPDRSSPVLRGKFVREQLLCQTISPPPQNIVITPPSVMAGVSTRQLFSMHATVEPCKSCHSLMDPVGFGFEHYDGIGRWRTLDQGQPVDASGTLTASDVNGSFSGAVDLAHKLAQSQEVSDCMAVEWFRYAMGRGETTDDACSLQSLKQGFTKSQANIRDLLVARDPDRRLPLQAGGSVRARSHQQAQPPRRGRRPRRHGPPASQRGGDDPSAQAPRRRLLGERHHLRQLGAPGHGDQLHPLADPHAARAVPAEASHPQRHQRQVGVERAGRRSHEGHGTHAHRDRAPARQHDGRARARPPGSRAESRSTSASYRTSVRPRAFRPSSSASWCRTRTCGRG